MKDRKSEFEVCLARKEHLLPALARKKYCLYEFKEIFSFLRNKRLEKCDQMSKERSSLTFILRLDAYVHSLFPRTTPAKK